MSVNQQDVRTDECGAVPAAAIREQLDRLVESPPFNHSRRFPTFLRFVVEHALSGNSISLKERTIGIELFGRDADYDTASDPIVRVTAAEIRKRIAQYYAVPEHQRQLRLSLPSGSYIPQFRWPQPGDQETPGEVQTAQGPVSRSRSGLRAIALIVMGLLLAAAGAVAGW